MKTKFVLIAVGLFLLGTGVATAQEKDRFSIGPRLGVNFSNVSNVDDSKVLTGLAFGLTSTYSLNETSGLTLDILYSGEGYKFQNNELKTSYLQIPIYYNLFFGELGEAFRPKVYIGVVPGFLLNAKVNDVEQNKDFYNGFAFALSGGLGFNYRLADRIWLNTDLRAYVGLSDLRDEKPAGDDTVAGRTYQLSLGVAFGL